MSKKDNAKKDSAPLKVGLLVYPGCMPAGLFVGLDFLRAANLVAGRKVFDASLVGLGARQIECAHSQRITPAAKVRDTHCDILMVPGFWAHSSEGVQVGVRGNKELQDYLKDISAKVALYSYCTGTVFHAGTGRLNMKPGTGTWWLSQDLQKEFPKVRWHFNKVLAESDLDVTAAGANGFYPLLSQMVSRHLGEKFLSELRKYLMTPVQFNANDPFYELEIISGKEHLNKIRRFVEKSPAREITLNNVATYVGLTAKTLSRKLQAEIKWTPVLFFRLIKLKQAATLLTTTEESVKEICDRLGWDDEAQFRKSFKRSVGMTPGEYKAKFKSQ